MGGMEFEEQSNSHPSLKEKLRHALCLYCCLSTRRHSLSSSPSEKASLVRASSTWLRSRAHDIIGPAHSHSSADFRYDPLSYALNFDPAGDAAEAPLRSFSVARPAPLETLKPVPEAGEFASKW